MRTYVLKRVLSLVPTLIGVTILVFLMIRLIPGTVVDQLIGPEGRVDESTKAAMRAFFGLDQPLHIQYWKWLSAFLTGDFGYSFGQMRPIGEILPEVLWNTMQLTLVSLEVIFAVGMLIGIVQAVRQYSLADNVLTFLALFFYSMPSFWFALMLILIFSRGADAGWLFNWPASGMMSIDYDYLSPGARVGDRLRHLAMPAIALGIGSAAGVARYMRGSMLEVIHQDFIRTARAKGLNDVVVLTRHNLKNAAIPIITIMGLQFGTLLGGAVVTETIFAWPGLGQWMLNAIRFRDYAVLQNGILFFALLILLVNLIVDISYAFFNPRIRYT